MQTKGWKRVMCFTYVQHVKTKSFRAGTIVMAVILALICIAINILPVIFNDDGDDVFGGADGEASEAGIKTVYLLDQTNLSYTPDFAALVSEGVEVTEIDASVLEETCQQVAQSEKGEVLIHAYSTQFVNGMTSASTDEENCLKVIVYRPESEAVVTADMAQTLADAAHSLYRDCVYLSCGVSEENLEAVKVDIESEQKVFTTEPEKSMAQQVAGAVVPMLMSLLLFCFIISYSQLIAQAIATEKTSRVMELLLTSVRPLAIIIGKVLGMLLVCVTQLAIFGAVGGIAFLGSMPFGFIPQTIAQAASSAGEAGAVIGTAATEAAASPSFGEMLNTVSAEVSSVLPGTGLVELLLIFLNFIMGFLFYALLAGLIGASVSRIEDMAQALQPLMLVSMAGFFLSYFPAIMTMENEGETNGLLIFSRYFPISSPFSLPSAILLGQISLGEAAIATLFLAVMLVLTAILVAKVYHHIVLYTGNPLKLKQIFGFLKKES